MIKIFKHFYNKKTLLKRNHIFSVVFVFVIFSFISQVEAASISLQTQASANVGDRISVDVLIDPQSKVVNSIETTIDFPASALSFNGFSSHQSGISLWVEQPREKSSGSVHFSGVIPGGLDRLYDPLNTSNTSIPIVRLFFVVKNTGELTLTPSKSLILENDGKGTTLPVVELSKVLKVKEGSVKDNVIQPKDTEQPQPFTVTLIERSIFGKTPRLAVFTADDAEGGIEHYEVAIGSLGFQRATSPYPLPYRLFSYDLTVHAYDFSGNVREQRVTIPGESPYSLGFIILVLLILVFLLYKVFRKIKNSKIGSVGVYTLLFILSMLSRVDAATFIVSPSQKEIPVGKTFSVNILAKSQEQAMNAVSGSIILSGGISVSSINTQGGIVDFWTTEPKAFGTQVRFEGIVLNPGYQGSAGKLFTINFTTRKEGSASITFSDGAVLANDGLGSNILDSLPSVSIRVIAAPVIDLPILPPVAVAPVPSVPGKVVALPVITEYSALVGDKGVAYLKGKGEPNALTKLSFKDVSLKSLGEQFIAALQTKKKKPTEALVKNDSEGVFQYVSPDNLVAGVYNVTPFLVDEDTQTQKPGFGVQVLVNNSKMVHWLVVLINILALLIPVACLAVIIYFIPWYSRLRMKILKHKIAVEDEQLTLSEKVIKEKEEHIGEVNH